MMHGARAATAALPAAQHAGHPEHRWGRALGREMLDTLLVEAARAAGALVLQPWSVQTVGGGAGDWWCEARSSSSQGLRRLAAPLLIDAHGSWEAGPGMGWDTTAAPAARHAADLFAFKANFSATQLDPGAISVLALDGGYGGMVLAGGGIATLACCIRRDRLSALRSDAPGVAAGAVVQAWLQRSCAGVRDALHGAVREGPWLAAGPLNTGVRVHAADGVFRVGNAAGEAHPILGEGMSMALQSAALLCARLLSVDRTALPARAGLGAAAQAALHARYAADWQRCFGPRLRLAAAFAHAASRPRTSALLMRLLRGWPQLLTHGARWGSKARLAAPLHELLRLAPDRHAAAAFKFQLQPQD
jgi:flavin-dependent dehydrogenase